MQRGLMLAFCLSIMLVVLVGCQPISATPGAGAAPTSDLGVTEELTPTAEFAPTDQVTTTLEITPTFEITPTGEITPTDGITGTEGVTGSEGMAGTEDVNRVEVELDSYAILMPETLPAGPTEFVVTNVNDQETHNFEIEGQGIEMGFEEDLQPGEAGVLQVDLAPGEYTVYCPVGDHEQQGMVLTLTVTAE